MQELIGRTLAQYEIVEKIGEGGMGVVYKARQSGLVEPVRGFGWVWRTQLGGAGGPMGWALDKEYGFDNVAQSQFFEQGLIFQGSGARTYVLLADGRFFAR